MPDITIHINTDNITPDELEKLHRDITRIKSLLFNLVDDGFRALPSPLNNVVDGGFRALPSPLNNVVVGGLRSSTSLPQRVSQSLRALPSPLQNLVDDGFRATTSLRLPSESVGRGLRAPTSRTEIQQQTTALQRQTTVLEQQIPVLETIEQVKRTVASLPQPDVSFREIQTQHITSSETDETQRQPTRHLTDITRVQKTFIDTIANVPNDLIGATFESLITIPAQTSEALMRLKVETEQDIAEINDSAVLSAQEKADRIEQIERNAAQRRKQIEAEANQAKIASFNKVVANFVKGIGRMVAEQVKLRIASQILGAQQAIVPFFATHPVLSIGAAALFSSSFDDPINDALAQQAGIRQAQQRATALGRRSAIDLKQNFEMGFVRETERQSVPAQRTETPAPIVKNEVKLIIGGQELKAIYEETQRQIAIGVISG